MRIGTIVLAIAVASATPLLAQDTSAVLCHDVPCVVNFEWGNSGGMPPDPDRRYGAPSDLESAFVAGLRQAGFQVTSSGQSPSTLRVRLTPQNRALCDLAVGTDPDYSCHTVQRASISIERSDAPKGDLRRVDVNPRCTDTTAMPTFRQFGQFAAEYFIYMAGGQHGKRPTTIKCT